MKLLTINDVIKAIRKTPSASRKKMIVEAYEFAEEAHRGQKRSSGEDYIQHSLATAKTLAEMGMG
ncbi:MAG TPA: hypothetical protein DEA27_04450, partial [Candidatus Moranbacteria bacterium]|nr:hypothetical protein [Candidatus Moranbacteria bacterium]